MSDSCKISMTDLNGPVSFGGGGGGEGERGGGGGRGGTLTSSPRPKGRPFRITPASSSGNGGVRDAVATGVCWTAGGAAGLVGALGAAAVTKNPVHSWGAGFAMGGAVGDICASVLKG